MKVAELMHKDVRTVDVDATVGDAVIALADGHVSAVPVVDHHQRVLGVVSTTDILNSLAEAREAGERERLFETAAREIMTPRPLTVSPEADVLEAARHLLYLEVHRLFVEADGRLVGVLSQTDIVGAVATAKI
jgi:CBS-domain-containing membrane protein